MAQQLTIARPYAKALFKDALDSKLLNPWSDVLEVLRLIAKNEKMVWVITNPKLANEQRIQVFCDLVQTTLKEAAAKLGDQFKNFITLLANEKRLILLPDIATLYHQLLIAEKNVVEAEVISAFPLSQDHREQLQERLEARFKSSVLLNFVKDKALIGGTVIRVGNWVMDDSIKGKLSKLADSLREAI